MYYNAWLVFLREVATTINTMSSVSFSAKANQFNLLHWNYIIDAFAVCLQSLAWCSYICSGFLLILVSFLILYFRKVLDPKNCCLYLRLKSSFEIQSSFLTEWCNFRSPFSYLLYLSFWCDNRYFTTPITTTTTVHLSCLNAEGAPKCLITNASILSSKLLILYKFYSLLISIRRSLVRTVGRLMMFFQTGLVTWLHFFSNGVKQLWELSIKSCQFTHRLLWSRL